MKAFGASPTVIPIADVYVSLQTHSVDGMAIPLLTVENFKFYELIKYISMTDHNHIVYMLFANKDVFAKLPKNLQQLVDKTFGAAAASATASSSGAKPRSQGRSLKGRGCVFNTPPIELFPASDPQFRTLHDVARPVRPRRLEDHGEDDRQADVTTPRRRSVGGLLLLGL